jgi:hypothetical protein
MHADGKKILARSVFLGSGFLAALDPGMTT